MTACWAIACSASSVSLATPEHTEVPEVAATVEAVGLVDRTEERRQAASLGLDPKRRVRLGQFFTPAQVADFIASLVRLPEEGTLRVLDPGAGAGSLTASLVARVIRERPSLRLDLTVCEIDESLHGTLSATLDDCMRAAEAAGVSVQARLQPGDFIEWASSGDTLVAERPAPFDIAVMNPPYRKLSSASRERALVAAAATEVSNLYTAFLALAANLLDGEGQLVAITPRSFANGPYFRSFRRFFLARMHLDRIHVFDSRTTVFGDSDVLQENVIFAATRRQSPDRRPLVVSTSAGYDDVPRTRTVHYEEVVHPEDPESFIHISGDEEDTELAAMLAKLPCTLGDLGLTVSTGRVVDFRAKEYLRQDPEDGAVPLIYPLHMREGGVRWPVPGARKPNAIVSNEATAKLMFPAGHYVIVKRMSSKEERRRVVASVFDPDEVVCPVIGFENHVNVFHQNGSGLPADLTKGLCLWLNSTVLDRFIRRFNGHTQINATDLRNLRYPSAGELSKLGAARGGGVWPDQAKIDSLVHEHVEACQAGA